LNDLEKDIKRKLEENLKATTEKEQKEKVLQKIFDANKLDIPNPMIEIALDEMMDEANSMFSSQGVNLNEYLKSLGKDQKAYRESLREDAKKRAKSKLIMGGIARQEGIEIAEKDIWKEIERLAKAYQTPVEKLKEQLNDLAIQKIKEDIKGRKAVDLIYEAAIVEEA
jgi:trigger factor